MKESYVEGLAAHDGPESCVVARKGRGEALTGVRAGRVLSRESNLLRGADAVEDKIVQRATVAVLNAIYETEFLGFSYGFRSGRSPHHALDALYMGLLTRKVNWVLEADIRGFFEAIDPCPERRRDGWLVKFIEHRIADRRVVRLIQKWLNAGVREDGTRTRSETGTPQGGSTTPPTMLQNNPSSGR